MLILWRGFSTVACWNSSAQSQTGYSDTSGICHMFDLQVSISGEPTKCRVCASISLPCFSTCKIQILSPAHLKEPAPPTSFSFVLLYQMQGPNTGAVAVGGKIARTVAFPTYLQASSSSVWLPWDRAIIPPCTPDPGETGPPNTQYSKHGCSMVFNPFYLLYKS